MMYVDNMKPMVGAEKRINIPYDENKIKSAVGLQLVNMVEISRGDSEKDKLLRS
jgi:hypothetical protein